jgi:hypothetical protein
MTPNAQAHRERPKRTFSDLAESHRGRDAVARWVRGRTSLDRRSYTFLRFFCYPREASISCACSVVGVRSNFRNVGFI